MSNVSMVAVVLQQEGIYSNHDLIQVVSSALIAIALLVQAVVVVVFVVGAMKTKRELTVLLRELHGRALPLIDTTNDLVQENAPRIRTITKNMVEASHNRSREGCRNGFGRQRCDTASQGADGTRRWPGHECNHQNGEHHRAASSCGDGAGEAVLWTYEWTACRDRGPASKDNPVLPALLANRRLISHERTAKRLSSSIRTILQG